MSECTQCPHVVGDSYQRDCCYPDCMGGYDQIIKQLKERIGVLEEMLTTIKEASIRDLLDQDAMVNHIEKALEDK